MKFNKAFEDAFGKSAFFAVAFGFCALLRWAGDLSWDTALLVGILFEASGISWDVMDIRRA